MTAPDVAAIAKGLLDYDSLTGEFRWKVSGVVAGCPDALGYRRIQIKGRLYKAHRLAWLFVYGEWPTLDLDHINRDPTDNRITNLRQATRAQQSQNGTGSNRAGFPRGVSWSGREGKYRAQIRANGRSVSLGYHLTVEAAADAYRAASMRLHGDFSVFASPTDAHLLSQETPDER